MIVIAVSSRWNHCLAQDPMFLFFQCQLAVLEDIGWTMDIFADGLLNRDYDGSEMDGETNRKSARVQIIRKTMTSAESGRKFSYADLGV